MKRVFLYAYDRQNLGDDLFVHAITNRYPEVQFYIWTVEKNKRTYATLGNLKVIDSESFLVRLLGRIRASLIPKYKQYYENKCEAVVYIGGSIFIEYNNWKQILNWWEYEADKSSFLALGANFGPFQSADFLEGHKRLFQQMKDVCFREKYSYELFGDVSTVRYAPDILFAQSMPERTCFKKQVFISLIDCSEKSEGSNQFYNIKEGYEKSLRNIVNGYMQDGYHVLLASFCQAEGDENTAEWLLSEVKDQERLDTLYYNGMNVDEVLKSIVNSDYVIASRFHAVILSIIAGKPVYPFIYSDKTKHVLEDIGFMNAYADLRDMSEIDYDSCKSALVNYQFDEEKVRILRSDAEKHFKVLDDMLL